MSELFDSLRRGRQATSVGSTPHTGRGEAVLATLGYTPSRRSARAPSVALRFLAAGAALGVALAVWIVYPIRRPVPAAATTAVETSQPRIAGGVQLPPSVAAADAPAAPVQPLMPVQVERHAEVHTSPPWSSPSMAVTAATNREARPHPSELDLALYYHRAGDFENALQHYRDLLRVDELDAQAHNNLGLLYQERNLLDESARELRRALAIEPGNAGTRNNYGVTLLKQGQVDDALAQFETASRLSPRNVDALVNAALARRDSNQPGFATETLLRALAIEPRNAAAHYNLAQLYDEANESAAAVVHYRKFLECAGADYASRAAAVRTRIELLSSHSN